MVPDFEEFFGEKIWKGLNEKIQQARRKARRKSDHDSWCGTACLSAKQKKREELLKARKKKKEYSGWCGVACLSV